MTKLTDLTNSPLEHNKNTLAAAAARDQSPKSGRLERIRTLNDNVRCHATGGIVVVTSGIAALGPEAITAVLQAVAAFDAFGTDYDPWDEHDCAALSVSGTRVIWKIDYYDLDRQFHSPDPADPNLTVRVLTIMLAEEY